jgi:hypothetical protein
MTTREKLNSTAMQFRRSKKTCVALQIPSSISPTACTATVYNLIYTSSGAASAQLQVTAFLVATTSSIIRCACTGTGTTALPLAITKGCDVPGCKRKATTEDYEAAFQLSQSSRWLALMLWTSSAISDATPALFQ